MVLEAVEEKPRNEVPFVTGFTPKVLLTLLWRFVGCACFKLLVVGSRRMPLTD